MTLKEIQTCFMTARNEEAKGKKHKGLFLGKPSQRKAEEYIFKAKEELSVCDIFKERGTDYKIPEQWYYTLYYCALAILSRGGVESRSQRCTALLLQYLQEKQLIAYDALFVDMILVYKEKGKESEVDKREEARYGSWIRSEEVRTRYETMMQTCKEAISQAEEIVYAKNAYVLLQELFG